jgi:hypothetical protein
MKKNNYITKQGIILENGMILSEDNILYEPDMIHEDTILLASSSWTRMEIKNVVGKTVEFTVRTYNNHAYNFRLI